jgi:RNA polymerase sigma-70 factor (ECF subfamily)
LVLDLFRDHATPLLKFLTARFKDREDAADVAQEAWLRLHRLEHPEALENPKAFLFQTASNLAVDRVRRQKLEQRYQDQESGPFEAAVDSPERVVAATETFARLQTLLEELPENCRHAFVMHRGRDMSYPEIARALGVSTSMVEKYIIRALKHFRARLDQEDGSARDANHSLRPRR